MEMFVSCNIMYILLSLLVLIRIENNPLTGRCNTVVRVLPWFDFLVIYSVGVTIRSMGI